MGPRIAAERFAQQFSTPPARFQVDLYGSLANTGKGHFTDVAILEELSPIAPTEIVWHNDKRLPFHPNGMIFYAFDSNAQQIKEWEVYSIGGGALAEPSAEPQVEPSDSLYPFSNIAEIQQWCKTTGKTFWECVNEFEDDDIWEYLSKVWMTMRDTVERGLANEGVLPGGLAVRRKASTYYVKAKGFTDTLRNRGLVYSYALATSEENASGGLVVTAPTCGSSGVLPAVLYYLEESRGFSEIRILRALATAGVFGNMVKRNASISGADVGCQGEVGVACAMAAAAACQLFGGTPAQIEYAAEMGLEHHLGLTCDPVCGMVQIPCIERNAFAAARAMDSNIYATFSDGNHSVSFDKVVEVMKQTGHDLPSLYKETSLGGLATLYNPK